jgi:hypothetical protein
MTMNNTFEGNKLMRHFGLFLIAISFLLSGCAVEMVKKNYAPAKGGTIRYSTGWFMADHNRSKAIEEMKDYCLPGKAQLLAEDSKKELTGQSYSNSRVDRNSLDTTTTQGQEGYVYLHFRCVKAR